MKKHKSAIISNRDFTKIIIPKKKHHYALPSEVIPEDENTDAFKETLVGMEYDIESNEDVPESAEDEFFEEDLDYLMSEIGQESHDNEVKKKMPHKVVQKNEKKSREPRQHHDK